MGGPEVYNLVTIGSIEEYRAVNGPQIRALRKIPISAWSYPCRGFAAYGSRKNSQVVLPDVSPIREFESGLKSIWNELEITDVDNLPPTIWVKDPLIGERDALDHVILQDLEGFRKQLYQGVSRFCIIPHANTPEVSQWSELLKKEYGIETELTAAPKPYEYPNIFDRSGFSNFANRNNLPVPYSRVAMNKLQLIEAYEDVTSQSGNKVVWAKLAATGGGLGINRVSSAGEVDSLYEKFNSLGILKLYDQDIPWEMQTHVDNILAVCSWDYHGNKSITPGDFTIQYMNQNDSSSWIGNRYNTTPLDIPEEVVNSIVRDLKIRTTTALIKELGSNHKYMGGFDFAITKDEQSNYDGVILEHNGARMSDSVTQIEAARSLGINNHNPFLAIKLGPAYCGINEFWQFLKKEGLSYNHGGQGVIPFVWFEDGNNGYASVIISAFDYGQMIRLYDLSINAMTSEGMIK